MKKEDFINKNIYTFLKGKIGKFEFTKDNLMNIKSISINAFDLSDNFISNNLGDLNYFENLEEISLVNFIINRPNIKIIENLKNLDIFEFNNCDFKDNLHIYGRCLKLNNCNNIFRISFENFENIIIKNCDIDNLKLDKVQNLQILNCHIKNVPLLSFDIKKLDLELMKIDTKIELLISKLINCNIKLIKCQFENDEQKKRMQSLKNVKIIKNTILTDNGIYEEEDL